MEHCIEHSLQARRYEKQQSESGVLFACFQVFVSNFVSYLV